VVANLVRQWKQFCGSVGSEMKMMKMVQVHEQCRCKVSPPRRKMVELWWLEAAAAAVEGDRRRIEN